MFSKHRLEMHGCDHRLEMHGRDVYNLDAMFTTRMRCLRPGCDVYDPDGIFTTVHLEAMFAKYRMEIAYRGSVFTKYRTVEAIFSKHRCVLTQTAPHKGQLPPKIDTLTILSSFFL